MTVIKKPSLRNYIHLLPFCLLFTGAITLSPLTEAQPRAQENDSCSLRISLLTCTPGQELYSIFGHTAIRVTNEESDWVFNYGTFDFSDPDFYTKFILGKLAYFLSVETFADFVYAYQWEKRGITEQLLDLGCQEKKQLFQRLIDNAQDANRYYKYDFLFDNCTTRAGDMIRKNNNQAVWTKEILPVKTPTYRSLLHDYLDSGGLLWSKLGIDILLGSRIDNEVTNVTYQFLPDNLMKGIDSTLVNSRSLVRSKTVLLRQTWSKEGVNIDPLWWFLLFSALILGISYVGRHSYSTWQHLFDTAFFSLLGLLGLLLVFMWWGTDHASCRDNYNLLWCLPTHLIMAWLPRSLQRIQRIYFQLLAVGTLIFIACWTLIPQAINISLLPLMALIIGRSWMIAQK